MSCNATLAHLWGKNYSHDMLALSHCCALICNQIKSGFKHFHSSVYNNCISKDFFFFETVLLWSPDWAGIHDVD